MRIIDFRQPDYYDFIVSREQYPDWRSTTWIRNEEVLALDPTKKSVLTKDQTEFLISAYKKAPNPIGSYGFQSSVRKILFGYCGELYLFYLLVYGDNIISTFKDIEHLVNEYNKLIRHSQLFVGYKPTRHIWYSFSPFIFNPAGAAKWHKEINKESKKLAETFFNLDSPIFIIESIDRDRDLRLVKNPQMKKYKLQHFYDSWTVYRDIEKYIGNDLVREPLSNFELTDEQKRDSKGFNKWSFKRRKNEKK
jgi:hypothetical protein